MSALKNVSVLRLLLQLLPLGVVVMHWSMRLPMAHAWTLSPFQSTRTTIGMSLNSNSNNNDASNRNNLVTSRLPHKLANGRGTFLGFRNTKDVPAHLNPR